MKFCNVRGIKKKHIVYLSLFILCVFITGIPRVTVSAIGWPVSLRLMFFIEFFVGISAFFLFFAKDELIAPAKIKIASVALGVIILIQFAYYSLTESVVGALSLTKDNTLNILIMVLIVPFYEEVFYRGCLLGFLKPLTRSLVFPIMATSVIFSLMHTQYNSLTAHFILFFVSAILCVVRIMTKSLLLPYLVHMSMNLFVFSLYIQNFY
ncbi:CPBP family intramembrane metalloprotease [Enterobacteriaceae bacterium H16N7]|nr:CPBP family intramembrane metalloprotease [Dryocola clanedunensis]